MPENLLFIDSDAQARCVANVAQKIHLLPLLRGAQFPCGGGVRLFQSAQNKLVFQPAQGVLGIVERMRLRNDAVLPLRADLLGQQHPGLTSPADDGQAGHEGDGGGEDETDHLLPPHRGRPANRAGNKRSANKTRLQRTHLPYARMCRLWIC